MDWSEFQNAKPKLSPELLVQLLEESYDLPGVVRQVKNLYSNLVYEVEVSCRNTKGKTYVIKLICKVLSSTFTKYSEEVKSSTRFMSFLREKGLNSQAPVATSKGDIIEMARFPRQTNFEGDSNSVKDLNSNDNGVFIVRLLTYIDGILLSRIEQIPDNVIFQFGAQMAKIHLATQELDIGKAVMAQWGKTYVWSLDQMPKIKTILFVVEDPQKKKLTELVMEAFENNVLSIGHELPQGYIHGDCKGDNCFVRQNPKDGQPFTELIDFDDAAYSCLVYDVAIAVKYFLTRQHSSDRDELDEASNFIQGYQTHRLLSQKEKNALFFCVCARLVQELVGDSYMSSLNHTHVPYLEQEPSWTLLEALWSSGKEKLKAIC